MSHPIGPGMRPNMVDEPVVFAIYQALLGVRDAWGWADVARQVEADLRAAGIVDPARRSVYCDGCGVSVPVVEEDDEEVGYEERARLVHVVKLDCAHDVVTDPRGATRV